LLFQLAMTFLALVCLATAIPAPKVGCQGFACNCCGRGQRLEMVDLKSMAIGLIVLIVAVDALPTTPPWTHMEIWNAGRDNPSCEKQKLIHGFTRFARKGDYCGPSEITVKGVVLNKCCEEIKPISETEAYEYLCAKSCAKDPYTTKPEYVCVEHKIVGNFRMPIDVKMVDCQGNVQGHKTIPVKQPFSVDQRGGPK